MQRKHFPLPANLIYFKCKYFSENLETLPTYIILSRKDTTSVAIKLFNLTAWQLAKWGADLLENPEVAQ
jgi:hypothetical protein